MNQAHLRVFFALACPPSLAANLCTWRAQQTFDGVPVPAANLHLTLAFLGDQSAAQIDALRLLASDIRVPPFLLQLDRLGQIGNGYACLLPSASPPALGLLARQLRAGLQTLGINAEPQAFQPHITLLRNAQSLAACAPALEWPVQHFGLYASLNDANGVRYQELGNWPLQAPR